MNLQNVRKNTKYTKITENCQRIFEKANFANKYMSNVENLCSLFI